IIARDSAFDGGEAGPASEALCLRMSDDAGTANFYVDLLGKQLNSHIDSQNPLAYDLHFNTAYPGDAPLLIEAPHHRDGTLTASYNDPELYTAIPTQAKQVSAEWLGNTLHVWTPRSELLSPTNGQALDGLYVDINHCVGLQVGAQCADPNANPPIVDNDKVP